MTGLLLLKLLLSFVIGGLFVAACTLAAERFGTNVGGVIGGIPSTIAVALFFIGLVSGPQAASEATDVAPLVVGFNGLFLVSFAVFAKHGLVPGLGSALIVWFVLSLGVALSGFRSFSIAVVMFHLLLFLSYYLFRYRLELPVCRGSHVRPTIPQIAFRAAFSGFIIASAVYLSKIAGPVVGGLFAVFPAVFLSTLLVASRSRGVEFARALTRPLMVSGMTNILIYAACVRYFYPTLGLALGTAGAFAASLVSAYGTYRFIRSRVFDTGLVG